MVSRSRVAAIDKDEICAPEPPIGFSIKRSLYSVGMSGINEHADAGVPPGVNQFQTTNRECYE